MMLINCVNGCEYMGIIAPCPGYMYTSSLTHCKQKRTVLPHFLRSLTCIYFFFNWGEPSTYAKTWCRLAQRCFFLLFSTILPDKSESNRHGGNREADSSVFVLPWLLEILRGFLGLWPLSQVPCEMLSEQIAWQTEGKGCRTQPVSTGYSVASSGIVNEQLGDLRTSCSGIHWDGSRLLFNIGNCVFPLLAT